MRTEAKAGVRNFLGRVGENETRILAFYVGDVLRDFPGAELAMMNLRPGDTDPYPVAGAYLALDGEWLDWTIQSGDLVREGFGQCELKASVDGKIAKSVIYLTDIGKSLDGSAEPPEPWESWVQQVGDDADRAEAAAQLLEHPGAEAVTLEPGSEATAAYSDGTFTFGIPAGEKGDPGEDGQDGYSPSAAVSKSGGTATITITDQNGTTTASVTDGQDGFSPVAAVSKSGGTATITITDQSGTTTAEVSDGQDGQPGADGYSPSAAVSKSGSTATITITDKTGTTTASVTDGQDGQDGYTPVRGTDYWTAADQAAVISEVESGIIDDTAGDGTTNKTWSADKLSELKSDLNTKAPAIYSTASGSIVSVSDGADGMPVRAMTVQIDPVQDLHGQSNPYPAGGGKNKLSYPMYFTSDTRNGCTATVAADGTVTFSGTPSADTTWNLKLRTETSGNGSLFLPEGEYILSGCPTGGSATTYQISAISNLGTSLGVDRGSGATITIPSGGMNIGVQLFVKDSYNPNSVKMSPMIRLSSVSDATFAPYSNICPITGWTGANAVRTGKNLIDQDDSLYLARNVDAFGAVDSKIAAQLNLLKAGTYTLSYKEKIINLKSKTDVARVGLYFRATYNGVNLNINGQVDISNPTEGLVTSIKVTFTLEEDYVGRFTYAYVYTGKAQDNTVYTGIIYDVQLELGSTATDYEPYAGTIYPISWQTEAETVYGGTLNTVTGVLTVDRAIVDMGDLNWSKNGDRFTYGSKLTPNAYEQSTWGSSNPMAICSAYKYGHAGNRSGVDNVIGFYAGYIYARDTRYETATDFKAGVSGVKVVYKLKTPITYNLTPTEITTLFGENHIWADCGAVSVEYPADTELYIDRRIAASQAVMEMIVTANREDSMKATRAYSSGDLLIVNGTLYKASTSIANGATLTVGTNVTATTVAAELAALA